MRLTFPVLITVAALGLLFMILMTCSAAYMEGVAFCGHHCIPSAQNVHDTCSVDNR